MVFTLYQIKYHIVYFDFTERKQHGAWKCHAMKGYPCVIYPIFSKAFLKILEYREIITRNWYNLEVFIPTLAGKKRAQKRDDASATTYVSNDNAKGILNPPVEFLIYYLARTTALTLNGFLYHPWYYF